MRTSPKNPLFKNNKKLPDSPQLLHCNVTCSLNNIDCIPLLGTRKKVLT
jgi:hypothetical protein